MSRTAAEGLAALCAALAAEGGTLADVAAPAPPGPAAEHPSPAQAAAAGPRARGREAEYELVLELVREGILLHYGEGRVTPSSDPDLALLLGDQLYALGLSRLAAMGDIEAVGELSDVISLVAQAVAAGDGELAAAVWEAGALAVGWGADSAHEQAKALARDGRPGASAALRASAARSAAGQ